MPWDEGSNALVLRVAMPWPLRRSSQCEAKMNQMLCVVGAPGL